MTRILQQLFTLWRQLGMNQKISLSLATLFVIGVMAGVFVWSSRPDMQLLSGGLDPKDAAEIVSALDAQGIRYEIGAGGTSISVPRDQVYRVRMDLAMKGLASGGVVGYEIFDRGNFGVSDFVQRTNNLRAIQGELARTINQLDGVRASRVMVVMPENRLLVTDTSRHSTASVMVDTGTNRLPVEAVNAIRSLVANAVEGLKVDDVVVVDNGGNVLSEELRSDSIGAGMTAGQIRYRRSLEEYFSRKVESMLGAVVGPGNAVVRVSVDVDNTSSTSVEERYNPDEQVLRSSTITEDSNVSTESRTVGTVGVASNAPPDAGANNNQPPVANAQQTRKSRTESYEISRSTVNTVHNPGTIQRLSAAVFVAMRMTGTGDARAPQPRTPEEIESLRTMVVNALGVTATRTQPLDQMVTVQEVDFANDPTMEPLAGPSPDIQLRTWIDLGQKVLIVVVALVGFLFFLRLLKRSQAEMATLELYSPREGGRAAELEGDVTPELLNDLIRQKPGNVGMTLKRWMSAEQK